MLLPSKSPARRRRKERLAGQLGLVASLLLPLLLLAGALAGQRAARPDVAAGYDVLNSALETSDKWIGRRLLLDVEENVTDNPEETEHPNRKNCTEPDLVCVAYCYHRMQLKDQPVRQDSGCMAPNSSMLLLQETN